MFTPDASGAQRQKMSTLDVARQNPDSKLIPRSISDIVQVL